MKYARELLPSDDPLDFDFSKYFQSPDVQGELTPESGEHAHTMSRDFLIGANELARNKFFVNVTRSRKKRAVDPASMTVLMVEDDNVTRSILELLLRQELGCEACAAFDLPTFVKEMQRRPLPDLLILDLELPGNVSGFNILAKVRSHPVIRELPVVIFTTHSEPEHLTRGLALGVDDYLSKPATVGALKQAISAILDV